MSERLPTFMGGIGPKAGGGLMGVIRKYLQARLLCSRKLHCWYKWRRTYAAQYLKCTGCGQTKRVPARRKTSNATTQHT